MKLVALVVLVAACDAGVKKQPTDHPPGVVVEEERRPAPADAVVVDAPPACSPGDLRVTGEQQAPRLVPHDGCVPHWDHIDDVVSMSRISRSGMKDNHGQPLLPPPERVVDENAGPAAIEVVSPSELASFVACKPAAHVDWKRDRVWLVTFTAESGYLSVESVIDDGHTATLGLLAGRDKMCGDAAPPENKLLALVLVPRDRDVQLKECRDDRPDPCPGYDGR